MPGCYQNVGLHDNGPLAAYFSIETSHFKMLTATLLSHFKMLTATLPGLMKRKGD